MLSSNNRERLKKPKDCCPAEPELPWSRVMSHHRSCLVVSVLSLGELAWEPALDTCCHGDASVGEPRRGLLVTPPPTNALVELEPKSAHSGREGNTGSPRSHAPPPPSSSPQSTHAVYSPQGAGSCGRVRGGPTGE